MNRIHEYIVSGAQLSDGQLLEILRTQMLGESDQRGWLQQMELSLDPYRTPAQQVATRKIKIALHRLSSELS